MIRYWHGGTHGTLRLGRLWLMWAIGIAPMPPFVPRRRTLTLGPLRGQVHWV